MHAPREGDIRGGGLAAALTTYVALSRGFVEVNPIFADNPWAAVWANVIIAVAVLALGGAVARALGVERYIAAMLLILIATKAITVISNVLILAGVIDTPLLPPQALFIPAVPTAALAVLTAITAVKQARFSARPHL